jgi:pimeloyl-ACP methyl ester carboxylesterase
MRALIAFLALLAGLPGAAMAQAPATAGVVVMHGKGGNPGRFVSDLARALEDNGVLVANLEMPWSGRRNYDVDVAAAEKQVQDALEALRAKGATKLFVAGHSQGGVFALHIGGRLAVDGVIPIAPGGSVASPVFRDKLGASLEQAKKYVAEGKGGEPQRLLDLEGSRGTYPIVAVPAAYVTWFDPEGAMNQMRALKALRPETPVLLIVPTRDYPPLLRLKETVFRALPPNRHTRLYEPDSDHLGSPGASGAEIRRWIREVSQDSAALR